MSEQLQTEVHQLQKDMRTANGKLDQVLEALSGSALDKNDKGLLGDMREMEKRVSKIERRMERAVYWIIGVSFGAGWGFADIISKFFNK